MKCDANAMHMNELCSPLPLPLPAHFFFFWIFCFFLFVLFLSFSLWEKNREKGAREKREERIYGFGLQNSIFKLSNCGYMNKLNIKSSSVHFRVVSWHVLPLPLFICALYVIINHYSSFNSPPLPQSTCSIYAHTPPFPPLLPHLLFRTHSKN